MHAKHFLSGLAAAAVLAIAGVASPVRAATPAGSTAGATALAPPRIDVGSERVAAAVRRILASGEVAGTGFLLVDKPDARLYVFASDGTVRGHTPVLLGSARGDHTVPGIGDRPIAQVLPHERTTPAGRFMGELGRNARNEVVVWVDYDAAVSIHRVLTSNRAERRVERLLSPTPDDNRISYGCINVLPDFFDRYVVPEFAGRRTPIYILPEQATGTSGSG